MTQQAQPKTQSAEAPATLESVFPFLPGLYSSQLALPALVAAERELWGAITAPKGALDSGIRIQLAHAAIRAQAEPRSSPFRQVGVKSALNPALETFATELSSCPEALSLHDIKWLTESGLVGSALIEAVSAIGMAQFFPTLAKSSESRSEWHWTVATKQSKLPQHPEEGPSEEPLLDIPPLEPMELKRSNSILREQYGFVPNLFAIQSHCPEISNGQVKVLDTLLFGEDHLSRTQKELIVLRLAALDCNTYLVTMQVNILGLFGVGVEECDQIIDTGKCARLSQAEEILLQEVGKLSLLADPVSTPFNRTLLQEHGFTDSQIAEGVATAALANFLFTVQLGLNPAPDFPPHRILRRKDLYPSDTDLRPTSDAGIIDPDVDLVAQVKAGNTEAFADLVRRHTRRVFGTLAGLLGNVDDARDSTQDVFLKAFQNIGNFQGRSRFSTWITSIAVNTGTELLRRRRPTESLDDTDEDASFRPRQIRSWVEDPEQQLAKAQINDLVRQGILRLPEKYRVALLLRDINQIPTEEAAVALNLSVPALKARVLRGRLMLRESLTPHFSRSRGEGDV
jgi:RNA polymerase sigma-70 factor (ECF subfamily)